MRRLWVIAGIALGLSAAGALAQTMQDARRDGQTFGQAQAAANQGTADTEAAAQANLPGYNGANAPQTSYMADPASLDATKAAVASSNEGYRLTVDGNLTRPRIAPSEVEATVARGNLINQSPDTYAQGLANGTTGQCVPLPPSTTTTVSFEATCNNGLKVVPELKSCAIPLVATTQTQTTTVYDYWVAAALQYGAPFVRDDQFVDALASGSCKIMPERLGACAASSAVGLKPNKFCKSYSVQHYQCSAPIPGETPDFYIMPITGHWYYATSSATVETVVTSRNEAQCSPLAADPSCALAGGEVCTDSDPVTRIIGTTSVTQPCWAWKRDYQCNTLVAANDCAAGTIPQGCTFAREECLDDSAPADPAQCKVFQEVYTCPITGQDPKTQYLCGGDVYCINGDCEPVVREASTEFKDALVGLHTLSEAGKDFNEIDYTLFKGSGQTCSKPVFGLANCCGGNGFPLIGTCTAADRLLANQIDAGLTHYVGTYCSKSFVGICSSKAQSYCVFGSKLTRILQEQGRPQIGKTWGTPKKPDCSGFTVDQFARLDLSVMDFAEIYQDFIQAAKLPDEAATLTDIQARIQAYYKRGP